jgi:protein-arginine kinase activator protein McsA
MSQFPDNPRVRELSRRLTELSHQKDEAVRQADYFRAAQLRDEAHLVKQELRALGFEVPERKDA